VANFSISTKENLAEEKMAKKRGDLPSKLTMDAGRSGEDAPAE
jgi:hypothetical protein